ncbi:hypothetical protein BJY52DRAFT_1227516 [Lactarius psammicola]|nr:hypothetical protein BJY52DRAFT_1227516 [Lactarius psammicola]
MTADLEFARKAERLEDLLSNLVGPHVLEASIQRGCRQHKAGGVRVRFERRRGERASIGSGTRKVVPKVVLRRRNAFGLSSGDEIDYLDYGSSRRDAVPGLQTGGETSSPSIPINNHATGVSSRSRSGSKERERGQPVVETGYGSEGGDEHNKSDLAGEISNGGDDDGMRNDATTRRDWLAKPKTQVGVKKQANCRGSNRKDNWFDVVVLEQLLYEHLCEVLRVPKQTQRLTRARDDKRRVIPRLVALAQSTYEVNIELSIESREKDQSRGHGPVGDDCQNRKTQDGPASDVTGRSLLESLPTLIKPMLANEDRNGSGFSDSASRAVPSPSEVVGVAANDQGVFCEGPSAGMGDSPPPLGVKLTCYRLLNVTTALLWIIPKAVLSYKNRSIAATTVDLLAALFGVV